MQSEITRKSIPRGRFALQALGGAAAQRGFTDRAGSAGRHPYRVSEPPGLVLPDAWEASGSCGGGGRASDPGSAQAVRRPGGFSAPQLLGKGAPCNASRRLARELPACFRFLVAAATRVAQRSEGARRASPAGPADSSAGHASKGAGRKKEKDRRKQKGGRRRGKERGFFSPTPKQMFSLVSVARRGGGARGRGGKGDQSERRA